MFPNMIQNSKWASTAEMRQYALVLPTLRHCRHRVDSSLDLCGRQVHAVALCRRSVRLLDRAESNPHDAYEHGQSDRSHRADHQLKCEGLGLGFPSSLWTLWQTHEGKRTLCWTTGEAEPYCLQREA